MTRFEIRHPWRIAIALAAAHALLAWFARTPGIFADQAVYVALARALRDFEYRELFRVDLPLHRMYPPAYPALLAIWSAIGGEQLNWLVIVSIACSVGALLLFFAAVHAAWGAAVAVPALGALSVNAALVRSGGWLMAEPPFLFLASLTLWALSPAAPGRYAPVLAGAAAIAAALTRTAGVTLVAAVALHWMLNRRYLRALVFGAGAAITVGGWLVFTASGPEQVPRSSYIADALVRPRGVSLVTAIVERASGKLPYVQHYYAQLPAPPVPGTTLERWIGIPVALAAAAVGFVSLYRRWPAAALYVATYGALLLVWPWALARFLIPLLPWLVLATLLGVRNVFSRVRPRWETSAVVVVALGLAGTGLAGTIDLARQREECAAGLGAREKPCMFPTWADFFAVTDRIRAGVPRDSVFVSSAAATLYLSTGHRAVSLPVALSQPPGEFLPFLRQRSVGYILLTAVVPFTDGSPAGGIPLGRMVKGNCRELRLEAAFPSASLFRVPAAGESAEGEAACDAADRFIVRAQRGDADSPVN